MSPKTRRIVIAALVLVTAVALTGCGSPNEAVAATGKGFWWGIWDGWTAVLAFIGNLFGGEYGIYESRNTGGWYDFGFLLGIGAIFGGGSSANNSRN